MKHSGAGGARHSTLLSHEFHASAPAINSHADVLQATTRWLSKGTRLRDGKADIPCRKFPLLPISVRGRIFLVSPAAFAAGYEYNPACAAAAARQLKHGC